MPTTWNLVSAKLEARRIEFQALHVEMEHDDIFLEAASVMHDQRMLDYLHGFPAGFMVRTPSLALDAVEVNTAQIMVGDAFNVKVLLPPGRHRGPEKEQKEREEADKLGKQFTALLRYINSYSSTSPFWGANWHMNALGMGCIAYPLNRKRWPKNPFKLSGGGVRKPQNPQEEERLERYARERFGAFPYRIEPIHPRRVFFDPYHDPVDDVILEELVAPAAYAEDYPHLGISPTNTTRNAKLVTFCSRDEYGLWLDGRPLLTKKDKANDDGIARNPTGIVWYKFCRYGAGWSNYKGDWEHAIQGILRAGRNVITSYTQNFNIQEFIKTLYAFRPLLVTGPDVDQAKAQAKDWRLTPAATWFKDKNLTVDLLQLPDVAEVVWQQHPQLLDMLEQRFGIRAMRGVPEDEPTGSLKTRLEQGKSHLRQGKLSFEQMVEGILLDIVYIQKQQIGEALVLPSPTGVTTIDPDDIPQGIQLVVEPAPPTPQERAFKIQELLQLAGAVPRAASRKRLIEVQEDISDIDEEVAQIMADEVEEGTQFKDAVWLRTQQKLMERGLLPQPTLPLEDAPTNGARPVEAVGAGGFRSPGQQPEPVAVDSAETVNADAARFLNLPPMTGP